MNGTLQERFEAKVLIDPNSGCHLWTAGTRNGYGTIAVNRTPRYAHRVVWELRNGPVPDGMIVCHKCDVRSCVNPDHLFLGTKRDNARDAAAKGRMGMARGEEHGMSKLTEDDVLAIRAADGTLRDIADRFGVTISNVDAIRRRVTWRHLEER